MSLNGLIINILLSFLKSIIEDSSMFKMCGYLFSQIGKIRWVEGSMNDIIFLAVIFVKCRIERLGCDVTVLMRWDEIYLTEWGLSLVSLLVVGGSWHL